MIQFQGLHGVTLAAPASIRFAREIGLMPRVPRAAPDAPIRPEGRPLPRRALRVLHALAHAKRLCTVDAIQIGAGLIDEPAQRIRDDLLRLGRHGYATCVRQPGRRGFWQITREGIARTNQDAESISLGDVLDSVIYLNASRAPSGRRWWPAVAPGSDRQPATTSGVTRHLTSGAKIAGLPARVAALLETLTQRGTLIAADWTRGPDHGRDTRLYWHAGPGHE